MSKVAPACGILWREYIPYMRLLLSIRHSRITSESLTTSAGEQQPHARDV